MEKEKETLDNLAAQDELKELDNLEDSLEAEDLKKLEKKSRGVKNGLRDN